MKYSYRPEGVCAREIQFEIEDGRVKNIEFTGGCNGNLKAISKILEGQTVDFIVDTLAGNTCGTKGTSCADQLSRAVKAAAEEESKTQQAE